MEVAGKLSDILLRGFITKDETSIIWSIGLITRPMEMEKKSWKV